MQYIDIVFESSYFVQCVVFIPEKCAWIIKIKKILAYFKGTPGLHGIMGNPGAPGFSGIDGCNGTDGM